MIARARFLAHVRLFGYVVVMRKTFPLAMLADLGLDGDNDTSTAKKPKRKRASKATSTAAPRGQREAEVLFSRLAKALAPSEDDVDLAWFEMNAG